MIIIGNIILFLYIELIAYLWHRFINHYGLLGDKIRVTHYCHHEETYPYDNMTSLEYQSSHDTWPWIIPIVLFGYIPIYLYYKKYDIEYRLYIIYMLQLTMHVFFISYIHDSYHIDNHWLNDYGWYKENKIYHYIHHIDNKNYGILTYIFDHVFGTFSGNIVEKKDVFNNLLTSCDNRIKFFDFLG